MPLSHVKSEAHFARAQKVIPGGVNSPARAFGGVLHADGKDHPGEQKRAAGPEDAAQDVDGACQHDQCNACHEVLRDDETIVQ